MIRTFLFDRGLESRFNAIRQAHRTLALAREGEESLVSTLCETLCVPGGYLHARVTEMRVGGAFRQVGSAGAAPDIPEGSHPGPVVIPLRTGVAASLPVTAGGEAKMTLLVTASSKSAFGSMELGDLAAVASRTGETISMLRLAARFDSLKKGYDIQSADLEAERDYSTRLTDLVPLPILQIGAEGEIRLFNRRSESLTGYRSSDVLNRRMPDLLIPEPFRSDFRRFLVEFFIGRRHGTVSFPLLTRSGDTTSRITWDIAPLRGTESGKITTILVCGDTTITPDPP